MAGYSKTPLTKKLGIKAGIRLHIVNPPADYFHMLGQLPAGVIEVDRPAGPLDFIHFFAQQRAELERQIPALKQALVFDGMLWVSWPKKASKVKTDLDENGVCKIGLQHGLVDVKVCAVDDIWSGLKFVYRIKDRK